MSEMRRKDRERCKEFALHVIDNCDHAVIAMIDTDGNPYCVPVSVVRIGDNIYFHCAKEGKKVTCLEANPRVCINCVTGTFKPDYYFTTTFSSATVTATAVKVTDVQEMTEVLRLICLRHNPGNMADFDNEMARSFKAVLVWRMEIDEIKGKERDLPVKDEQ